MRRLTDTLGRVRVAAPCEENWDEMRGDERVRFCQRCSLNVYNLSAMTRREAERVVLGAEGRLCVRFYRRRDGTMLTQNCPTGLARIKRRVSRVGSAAAAAAVGLFTGTALAPQAPQTPGSEVEVALTPPETETITAPVASGSADTPAVNGEPRAGADAYDAEASNMTAGGMSLDPAGVFAPFILIGALFTLLTWPLLLLGCRDKESDGEGLRIWSNGWGRPDETTALPREGSAVDPN